MAAISTAVEKVYPFLVRLEAEEGGPDRESVVNTAQVLAIDKSRLVKKLGSLPQEKMSQVDRALIISLGLKLN